MAWQSPLSTTGPSIALNLGVSDSGIVAQGVTLASTTHRGIYAGGTDQDVIVDGTVIGNNGIRLFDATGADVVIGAAGHAIGFGGPGLSGKGNLLEVHNARVIDTLAGNLPAVQFQGPSAGSSHELADAGLNAGDAKGDRYFDVETCWGPASRTVWSATPGTTPDRRARGGQPSPEAGGAHAFVFVASRGQGLRRPDHGLRTDVDEIRLDDNVFKGLALERCCRSWPSGRNNSGRAQGRDRPGDPREGHGLGRWTGTGDAGVKAFEKLSTGLSLGADDFLVI
jgi:hypothetical protein